MTQPPPELLNGEVLMPDPDPSEGILRGLHTRALAHSRISFEAFMLSTPEKVPGNEKLSSARATLQTAQGLHAERTAAGAKCVGVATAAVGAIIGTDPELRVVDDSALVTDATGHAYIDMRTVAVDDRRLVAQELAETFNNSGTLHRLETPDAS